MTDIAQRGTPGSLLKVSLPCSAEEGGQALRHFPRVMRNSAAALSLLTEEIVSAIQKQVGVFTDQEIPSKLAELERQITEGQDPRKSRAGFSRPYSPNLRPA